LQDRQTDIHTDIQTDRQTQEQYLLCTAQQGWRTGKEAQRIKHNNS